MLNRVRTKKNSLEYENSGKLMCESIIASDVGRGSREHPSAITYGNLMMLGT